MGNDANSLQTVLNVLDFRMPIKKAMEAPRIHHQWLPDELAVEGKIPPNSRKALEKLGHKAREKNPPGPAAAIAVKAGKITGENDPRKEESEAAGGEK